MSTPVFVITILIMAVGMLSLLLSNIKSLPVAKAGKVSKFYPKKKTIIGSMPNKITRNGESINVGNDEKMIVHGNSMGKYKIYDGQRIYVRKLNDDEKNAINTYPVLVFNIIDNPNKKDAKYKLRKFVGYIDNDNWDKIYEKYQHRISINRQDFIEQCKKKYSSIPHIEYGNLILSETYDEDNHIMAYSLHPKSLIYGKVEYVF